MNQITSCEILNEGVIGAAGGGIVAIVIEATGGIAEQETIVTATTDQLINRAATFEQRAQGNTTEGLISDGACDLIATIGGDRQGGFLDEHLARRTHLLGQGRITEETDFKGLLAFDHVVADQGSGEIGDSISPKRYAAQGLAIDKVGGIDSGTGKLPIDLWTNT